MKWDLPGKWRTASSLWTPGRLSKPTRRRTSSPIRSTPGPSCFSVRFCGDLSPHDEERALARVSNHEATCAAILRDARLGRAPQDEVSTMRLCDNHTFSNGTSILLRLSSHSGTGRFFARMKSGLNSFDW